MSSFHGSSDMARPDTRDAPMRDTGAGAMDEKERAAVQRESMTDSVPCDAGHIIALSASAQGSRKRRRVRCI